jgi:hypothetical protein
MNTGPERPPFHRGWPARRVRLVIWLLYALGWTIALLAPSPFPETASEIGPVPSLLAGKALHLTAYALFALLTAWVSFPRSWRWPVLGFLLAHALLTEYLQFVLQDWTQRTGNWRDASINVGGILLGVLVTWNWWRVERNV